MDTQKDGLTDRRTGDSTKCAIAFMLSRAKKLSLCSLVRDLTHAEESCTKNLWIFGTLAGLVWLLLKDLGTEPLLAGEEHCTTTEVRTSSRTHSIDTLRG